LRSCRSAKAVMRKCGSALEWPAARVASTLAIVEANESRIHCLVNVPRC